jgi:hypothetical protein
VKPSNILYMFSSRCDKDCVKGVIGDL